MSHDMDLSYLDRQEILEVIFPLVYSPFIQNDYLASSPSNAKAYSTEVESCSRPHPPEIRIHCYPDGQDYDSQGYISLISETDP